MLVHFASVDLPDQVAAWFHSATFTLTGLQLSRRTMAVHADVSQGLRCVVQQHSGPSLRHRRHRFVAPVPNDRSARQRARRLSSTIVRLAVRAR